MRVKSAEFILGVVRLDQLPRTAMPEIAWAGRSNVGKSSLINKVINRKGLARTSNTPGKTRELNFYRINGSWHLVDLPGYGFARGPAADRERWGETVEPYLRERLQLAGVVVLVDARHGATDLDRMMFDWLADTERNWVVVMTKTDKISGNTLSRNRAAIRSDVPEPVPVLEASALTGRGVDRVRAWVDESLDTYRKDPPAIVGWSRDIE